MTKKFHILLFVFVLGFLAKPTETFACGTSVDKTEKSCCSKEKSSSDKKDCCKNSKSEKQKKDKCNGNCKSCSCPVTHFSHALPVIELKDNNFKHFCQKPQFINHEFYLSEGYYSIWTPPNIG